MCGLTLASWAGALGGPELTSVAPCARDGKDVHGTGCVQCTSLGLPPEVRARRPASDLLAASDDRPRVDTARVGSRHHRGRRDEARRAPGELRPSGRRLGDRADAGRGRSRGRGSRPGQPVGDGPLLPDGWASATPPHRCSRPTPPWDSWPPTRARSSCRRWSPASPTATRDCSRRSSRPSTCSPAGARCSDSGRRGTSASTSGWVCPSRRCRSGSSGSRRRCRSSTRCGATTTAPTTARTTSSPRRSARRGR